MSKEFETFVVNYDMQPEHWDMEKSIAMCVQEEERIKNQNVGFINHVQNKKKKSFHSGSSSQTKDKAPMSLSISISKRTVQRIKMSVSIAITRGITRKIVPLS